MSTCSTAKGLEYFCGHFFDLERTSKKKWRILETSFTDVIISRFRQLNPMSVDVDASDESITGADMEILFLLKNDLSCKFIVQAKRAAPSSPKSINWSYKELSHKIGHAKGYQIDQLISYGSLEKSIPLYVFYHSNSVATFLKTCPATICSANRVHDIWTGSGNKVLKCSKFVSASSSFRSLFCDFPNDPEAYLCNLTGLSPDLISGSLLEQTSIDEASRWLHSSRRVPEVDGFASKDEPRFGPEFKIVFNLR